MRRAERWRVEGWGGPDVIEGWGEDWKVRMHVSCVCWRAGRAHRSAKGLIGSSPNLLARARGGSGPVLGAEVHLGRLSVGSRLRHSGTE